MKMKLILVAVLFSASANANINMVCYGDSNRTHLYERIEVNIGKASTLVMGKTFFDSQETDTEVFEFQNKVLAISDSEAMTKGDVTDDNLKSFFNIRMYLGEMPTMLFKEASFTDGLLNNVSYEAMTNCELLSRE